MGRRVALLVSWRTRRWLRRGAGEGTACGVAAELVDASLVASWCPQFVLKVLFTSPGRLRAAHALFPRWPTPRSEPAPLPHRAGPHPIQTWPGERDPANAAADGGSAWAESHPRTDDEWASASPTKNPSSLKKSDAAKKSLARGRRRRVSAEHTLGDAQTPVLLFKAKAQLLVTTSNAVSRCAIRCRAAR